MSENLIFVYFRKTLVWLLCFSKGGPLLNNSNKCILLYIT